MTLNASTLAYACNTRFLNEWNTKLVGGFAEPLYLPSVDGRPAEIQFREDFIKSALHELAHWCLAGEERRKLIDYGYWYSPDGRSPEEQKKFFAAEVKPQAIEMAFSLKAAVEFEVSCDNLQQSIDTSYKSEFEAAVLKQFKIYETHGFSARVRGILQLLESLTKDEGMK